jgi:cyclophilin family peptidyl-prolyl cis-trans isomerase
VERIKTLARKGFYDGVVFHRVIEGFMAQTGDPTGTGSGGSDLPDLKAEFKPSPCAGRLLHGPHQPAELGELQFFICFDDARFLDKQYTVWGKVVEGMENVDKIKRGEPVRDPDRIVSMKVMATRRSSSLPCEGAPTGDGGSGSTSLMPPQPPDHISPGMREGSPMRVDLFDFDLPRTASRSAPRSRAMGRACSWSGPMRLSRTGSSATCRICCGPATPWCSTTPG